jgi:hypothetical protein
MRGSCKGHPSSSRRRPGPITPGVNCNRRHLPNCRKRESSPYGSRRGGRDDVSGFFGFIELTYTFAFSRQHSPEVCKIRFAPKKEEGAGKTGCALHPRPRVQRVVKKAHTSIQVQRKHSGLPRAMVLRLIPCSPRRDLACLSPSLPRSLLPRNLTPAIGASGPHDFAVRVTRRSSKALSRPPLPVPRQ